MKIFIVNTLLIPLYLIGFALTGLLMVIGVIIFFPLLGLYALAEKDDIKILLAFGNFFSYPLDMVIKLKNKIISVI